MSVAVYNHYKRVATNTMDEIEIEIQYADDQIPQGCGKTYLGKNVGKAFWMCLLPLLDATSLTEAGYIGDDIECGFKLLAAADNDVEKAEHGIILLTRLTRSPKRRIPTSGMSAAGCPAGNAKASGGGARWRFHQTNSKNAMIT